MIGGGGAAAALALLVVAGCTSARLRMPADLRALADEAETRNATPIHPAYDRWARALCAEIGRELDALRAP